MIEADEESEKEMQYTSAGNPIISIDDEFALSQTETERPYILAVDDDTSILSIIMQLLETEGYSCMGFSESERVLPFLQEIGKRGELHLPSLLLLDLMMPRVSGYDIARWLFEHEPYTHIPILLITADPRARDISVVPSADDCLLKPFQVDVLISKVEHYLLPLLDGS